jgi:hypothetical protein
MQQNWTCGETTVNVIKETLKETLKETNVQNIKNLIGKL